MPRTFSPPPRIRDPDMHHGTCVTHVPWCMPGSLPSGFLWSRSRRKRSRRMHNLQFCVSGKRSIKKCTRIYSLPRRRHIGPWRDELRDGYELQQLIWHVTCGVRIDGSPVKAKARHASIWWSPHKSVLGVGWILNSFYKIQLTWNNEIKIIHLMTILGDVNLRWRFVVKHVSFNFILHSYLTSLRTIIYLNSC